MSRSGLRFDRPEDQSLELVEPLLERVDLRAVVVHQSVDDAVQQR